MNRGPNGGGRRPPAVQRLLASVAGGSAAAGVLAVSQNVAGCPVLALVGLIPLVLVLDAGRFWKAWGQLSAFYSLFNLLTLYWFCTWGPGHRWVFAGTVPYSCVVALVPAVCCRFGGLLAFPAGWALMEVLQRYCLLRTSWALVGMPLVDWPAAAAAISVAGAETLSFLCATFAVAVAVWLRPASRAERWLAVGGGAGLVTAILLAGLLTSPAPPGEGTLRVAVIQPDLVPAEVHDRPGMEELLRHLDRLINRTLSDRPDVIVLPETALPNYVRYDRLLTDWVKRTVAQTRRPLLFGTFDHDEGVPDRTYNVAILVTPYDTVTTYRKTRLVPLGEYVPASLPFRAQAAALLEMPFDLYPGEETTLFRLAGGEVFAAPVCFEEVAPDVGRNFGNSGAKLLVSLVNMAHVKYTSEPLQQVRRAQLMAAAAGLPLVRCLSGGPSGVINAAGGVESTLADAAGVPLLGEGSGVLVARLGGIQTIYRWGGDGLAIGLFATLVFAAAARTHGRAAAAKFARRRPAVTDQMPEIVTRQQPSYARSSGT